MSFSGSYAPEDVTFLLKPVQMASTPLELKETLLQSGRRHYSEMITAESPPDEEYLALFEDAFALGRRRLAHDVASLARALAVRIPGEVVIVSLARAGTPIGALLRRALFRLGCASFHYSISIIRGRGIDQAALDHILERHDPASLVFVDGWTGKGAIAAESSRRLSCTTVLVACVSIHPSQSSLDLAGVASLAASGDDYLIPCSILNAVISGLVSRTILGIGSTWGLEISTLVCTTSPELPPHAHSPTTSCGGGGAAGARHHGQGRWRPLSFAHRGPGRLQQSGISEVRHSRQAIWSPSRRSQIGLGDDDGIRAGAGSNPASERADESSPSAPAGAHRDPRPKKARTLSISCCSRGAGELPLSTVLASPSAPLHCCTLSGEK